VAGLVSRLIGWMRAEPDRTVGGVLVALAGGLLVAAYLSVDNHPVIADQLSTLIIEGVGGLVLLSLGSMILVLSDLADEWHKLDRIESLLDGRDQPVRRPGLLGLQAPLRAPLVLGGIGTVLGGAIVVVAWNRATGSSDPKDGFGAVALGIDGLVVAGAAVLSSTFWFVRIVRLRASRLFAPWMVDELHARVRAAGALRPRYVSREQQPSLPATIVVGGGLRHFHATGCGVLATGGPYDEIDLARAPRGLAPCGLCLPELANGAVPMPARRVSHGDAVEGATAR
jgi:hypothetical protein